MKDIHFTLIDESPIPLWRCNDQGQRDYFNRTWLEFTGRALQEELHDGWTQGVHPDDRPAVLEALAAAVAARQASELEYRLRHRDGEYRWMVDKARPLQDPAGKFVGYIGSSYDISKRKHAEQALRESEGKFAAFMDYLPGLAWMKDLQGRHLYINQSLNDILPRNKDNWLGKNDTELWPWEIAETFQKNDQQVVSARQQLIAIEPYVKEGKTRYGLVSKFPILNDKGDIVLLGGVAIDITDLRQMQQERDELYEKTRATRDQLRHLAQKIIDVQEEERSRISRELHDEAGQVLTALKLNLSAIIDDLPRQSVKLRDRMQDAVMLTDTTMESIRSLAHNLRPPALDAVALDACLEGLCLEMARRTGVTIVYQGTDLQPIPDPVKVCLYRVLQEALTNVARHAQAKRVQVTLELQQKRVVLTIQDDGRGFSSAERNATQNQNGIGLVGIEERLRQVDGRLQIHSQPGLGTQIVADIPLSGNFKSPL